MMAIFFILRERLLEAIVTIPNYHSLAMTSLVLLVYGCWAIALGFGTNFLQWNLCKSQQLTYKIIATSFFAPALIEEVVFRILLLPYPAQNLELIAVRRVVKHNSSNEP